MKNNFQKKLMFICTMLFITFVVTIDVNRYSSRAFDFPGVTYVVEKVQSLGYGKFNVKQDGNNTSHEVGTLAYYYEPAWMPKGFELIEESKSEFMNTMTYKNEVTNKYISYSQTVISTNIAYNIEGLEYEEFIQGENMYYCTVSTIQGSTEIFLIWNEGICKFQLLGNIQKEDIIKIADSVKITSKVDSKE